MNGHDTDPTPPHGTERPPAPDLDLRGRFAARFPVTNPDSITNQVLDALDALALAVWAYHHGDEHALRDALVESGRDWFGWSKCDICGEDAHRDDLNDHDGDGVCDTCADDIAETIRAHAEEIATETGDFDDDDQDRDAYGAPYGGRDDLNDECARCGETGRTLNEASTCADCLGLYPEEMGETEPCEFGHFDCATEEGGRCSNLRAALDRVGEIIEANADRLSAVLDD